MPRFIAIAVIVLLPCLAAGEESGFFAVIDWSHWDAILRSHVIDGEVAYAAIADDEGFAAAVTGIATADLEGSSPESLLAFYINAYNVLAVQAILNGRSPSTNLGKLRFFYRDKYTVAGEKMSLHALEKGRIRSLGEPRIHFAIVCASASCPQLLAEALREGKLKLRFLDYDWSLNGSFGATKR